MDSDVDPGTIKTDVIIHFAFVYSRRGGKLSLSKNRIP